MHTITLDSVLDEAMLLDEEQREMLVDILHSRQIEMRRDELARDAKEGIAAFHRGELQPQTAEEIVKDLHESLNED
ncbi:MAG: hypothetical protein ABI778_07735 [Ignavibacteriota bacterium]